MWLRREMNSIFYVDSDYESIGFTSAKMETEVRTLKEELAHTQETLKAATKRCRDLVRELDSRNAVYESERTIRDQQLSRILRALLVLEARLKQEQKSIRQVLCEKDNVIRNQQLEIARLRRYTKNYIKSKREQILGRATIKTNIGPGIDTAPSLKNIEHLEKEIDSRQDDGLSKDIENLKCEIITKLNSVEIPESLDRGIKKTYSFAGSDVSKTSITSSENTDVSIITTTTEGSPSLISTEGFCEGESTDVSPSSTLNKSNRCTPTTVTDSENETTMIFDEDNNDVDDEEDEDEDEDDENNKNVNDDDERETLIGDVAFRSTKRKTSIGRSKLQKSFKGTLGSTNITRTESKDDGMDCNFVSEDEEKEQEQEQEPIYVNSCNENNAKNLEHANTRIVPEVYEDHRGNNDNDASANVVETEEQNAEETSGNWYSDPDEDKNTDDVFRHSYRSNSNHNSVLECVNQILLRDMEEEEHVLSIPRRFKHRGRTVRFQPARLSDIESVGSEMERKNSEEGLMEKETLSEDFGEQTPATVGSFEATASEDEYGMRIAQPVNTNIVVDPAESVLNDDSEEPKVIPIVIIEPKVEPQEAKNPDFLPACLAQKPKIPIQSVSPPLRMERIEEKTCLQMTKRLTIAKNLDYEDIESLPEVILPSPKTPPALPPKPQFRNNTLILKKIPSPSFLIDETRKKLSDVSSGEHGKKIFGLSGSPTKSSPNSKTSAKSLNFEESPTKNTGNEEEGNFWKNRFNNVRSSFQARHSNENVVDQSRKVPRVTNIVRHFEEFKIGGEQEEQSKQERGKTKERYVHAEFGQEFDIRQNFEEFNLDECDLSDDPNRPEADGSERLVNLVVAVNQNETSTLAKDNNNVTFLTNNANTGYDNFLEATGLSNKSILTPSRLLSNHKSMLKPKDVKYKNKIKASAVLDKHSASTSTTTHVRHWTGPFV
ncbi:hypothetical protein KPH14_008747 [Odynerus spinipes]|uniref:Uncharacterized protein n=1 Tax=Odynerus spinipes TaxID=1348599 RepID=A0AAD9R8I3_9HYME|nr:hypothetical protein KPH14_008747 [Odynerus spinipes]